MAVGGGFKKRVMLEGKARGGVLFSTMQCNGGGGGKVRCSSVAGIDIFVKSYRRFWDLRH